MSNGKHRFVPGAFRINRLTRFEIARIVGARSLQLALGAPPLIDTESFGIKDPVAIAIKELLENLLPMTVRRPIPGGGYELIPVSKLLSPENREYLENTLRSWNLGS
jgi:DNA-directed RNA polymerase subunit K